MAAGQSVVADAVYESPEERSGIEAVATGLGLPFRGLWLTATGDTLAARVTARRDDASDATPQVVAEQLTRDPGLLSPAWATLDAGAGANETLRRALVALGQGPLHSETAESTGEAP